MLVIYVSKITKMTCDSSFLLGVARGNKKAASIWSRIKEGSIKLLIPSISFVKFCSELLKNAEERYMDVFLAAIRAMLNIKVIPIDLGVAIEAGHFMQRGLEFEAAIVGAIASMYKVDGIISINKQYYTNKLSIPVIDEL